MKISGLQSGMVMQRGSDDCCDVFFRCDEEISSVRCSDTFEQPSVRREGDGYRLTGIGCGGPYTLWINDTSLDDIYVGDVWILAGQSNMQGIGRAVDIHYNSNGNLRAYYMQGEWEVANHPLHQCAKSPKKVHTEVLGACHGRFSIRTVGCGLAFAEKMYALTHIPQGLICCAHGGTNLDEQWSPRLKNRGGDGSLYAAMIERFEENGSNVRGVFWYQGCSDAFKGRAEKYTDNMVELIRSLREDIGQNVPVVQVQIARTSMTGTDGGDEESWSSVREQQRLMHRRIEKLDTVHTVAYRLDDCIHLSAKSQELVGHSAAESMFCMLYGKLYGCLPGIRLKNIECIQDESDANMSAVILAYDNVHGELSGGMRPMGYDLGDKSGRPLHGGIHDVVCDGNRVILHTDFSRENILKYSLYYGCGKNPTCNIVDGAGRSLPAFGPISIADSEKML